MTPYSVHITDRAWDDLNKIAKYITLTSPQNARSVVRDVLELIDALQSFPQRFSIARDTDTADADLRQAIEASYRVLYRIDEETRTVYIRKIIHAARDGWK